jgi:hypothetical protein
MTCGSSSARLLVCASLVVCSCALQTATINQFVDPAYGPGTVNKLAVFPIRNQRLAPSEAQQVNRKISTAINQKNPRIQIMAAPEATQLLNDNGLAESWASFLDNYISSGVPDVKKLRSIGEALGVDDLQTALPAETVFIDVLAYTRFEHDWSRTGNRRRNRLAFF